MKIKDHGYWASKLFYYQSILHYYWLSFKFGSFTFFTLANPEIKLGGMLDDRKTDIYDLVPSRYLPATILFQKGITDVDSITFPIIAKPNVGFKGHNVELIKNKEGLEIYLSNNENVEVLLQEYIDLPNEYSILFYCLPKSKQIGITSFVEKTFPFVIGDGLNNLSTLIDHHSNPFLDKAACKKSNANNLNRILRVDEKMIIERIGNYSRGANFISLNHCIDTDLITAIDNFQQQVNGIQFFRLDLKSNGVEAIKNGNFKILEINGAKGEPLHIYDKSISWRQKVRDIKTHWRLMSNIVTECKKEEEAFVPVKAVWPSFTRAKNLTK